MEQIKDAEIRRPKYPKIAEAYKKLDEKYKKKLFSKLGNQNPKLVEQIRRKSGLGGIRTTTITERLDPHRKRIDGYLLGEDGIEKLVTIIAEYFVTSQKDLIDDYEVFMSKRIRTLDNLEQFRLRLIEKGEPFADLFAATLGEWLRGGIIIQRLPEQLSPAVSGLESLNQQSETLLSAANKINAAIPLDIDEIKRALESAQNSISEVRSALEKIAAPFGLKELKWEDRQGLNQIIEAIAEKICDSQNVDKKVQEFINGLAIIIGNLKIIHRSEKKARLVEGLRAEVVTELQKQASSMSARPIPGSDRYGEPIAWLGWSLALAGDELTLHESNLREAQYVKLSEFIEETDANSVSIPEPHPSLKIEVEEKQETPVRPVDSEQTTYQPQQEQRAEDESSEKKEPAILTCPVKPAGFASAREKVSPPVEEKIIHIKTQEMIRGSDDEALSKLKGMDPRILASELIDSKSSLSDQAILSLAWNLVRFDHLSYAFHLCNITKGLGITESGMPVPWILEMIVLSRFVDYNQTPLIQRLQQLAVEASPAILFNDGHPIWGKGNRLLLSSASLRAAVLAPAAGYDQILKSLRLGDMPGVYDLVNEVVSFAERHLVVAPEFLAESLTLEEWNKKKSALIAKIKQWWEASIRFNTNFAPATRVWQQWLKPGEVIFNLIRPILDGNEDRYESQAILNSINWDKLIDRTNQRALKRNQSIEGQARKMLIRRGEDAITLAKEWLKILSSKPGHEVYNREPIQRLIRAFDRLALDAASFLQEISNDTSQSLAIRVGANLVMEAISDVHAILKGKRTLKATIWDPNLLINLDLLLSDEIGINAKWESDAKGDELRERVVRAVAKYDFSLEKAFHRHCETGDHLASQRIIDFLRESGTQSDLVEMLERQREESRRRHVDALMTLIGKARLQLSESLVKGLTAEAEFLKFSDYIERLDRILSDDELRNDFNDFRRETETLKTLQSSLSRDSEKLTQGLRDRLSRMEIPEQEMQRINAALDKGDIHLATDFMDRLESGLSLPEESLSANINLFPDFFGLQAGTSPIRGHFLDISNWLTDNPRHDAMVPSIVAKQTSFAGIDMRHIPGSQCRQYADTLKAWFTIKRQKKLNNVEQIKPVLAGLGFNILDLQIATYGNKTWLKVKAEPITNSPIAHYGSEARGKYNILLDFSLTNEEDLMTSFDNMPRENRGNIVFYFGRLSEKQRRNIARHCIKNKRTVIVVDDIVMIYLASVRGGKIPALLSCTLPFTYFMPYMTMASLLPSEMFFGRSREIAALETMSSSEGSCFVYGGRQIGKTVLLKQVQKRVHDPEQERIAKYIDLKLHGFGQTRSPESIWAFLIQEIKSEAGECFPESIPSNVKYDWFSKYIKKWLQDESSERRILLLLDEADTFLTADAGKDYSLCREFKGLMEETNLRFKTVFAGLHNVQRSTRVSNNPLAHLGTPVCVGPLLQGGEAREAQALIQIPLAAAGVFFESSDLIIRILAQANYYPNLIQIYCQNLLLHVMDTYGLPGSMSIPPYLVTSGDIKDVYERQQLRDDLRQRFRLTLDLDPRFNLIAHILALYYEDYGEGFESHWIHKNALEWWPAGFQESQETDSQSPRMISFDSFQYLLDEMSGLGILRKIGSDKYNLRSPNVVSLLGTRVQIERVLEEFYTREGQWSYAPDAFRSLIDKHDSARRSPLTAAQESFFKKDEYQVAIIAGTDASGLEDVPKALTWTFGNEFIRIARGGASLEDFQKYLSQLTSRKGQGKTFLLIPPDSDWQAEWLREAESRLKNFTRKEAAIAVVFLAGPEILWRNKDKLKSLQTDIITLHPWKDENVRIWLQDAQLGYENKEIRKQIFDHTGYWPLLLRMLASCTGNKQIDPTCLSKLDDQLFGSYEALEKTCRWFGLGLEYPAAVLKVLADWNESLSNEELIELLPPQIKDQGLDLVSSAIWWAKKLDLVRLQISGWEIDPFVQKILAPAAK